MMPITRFLDLSPLNPPTPQQIHQGENAAFAPPASECGRGAVTRNAISESGCGAQKSQARQGELAREKGKVTANYRSMLSGLGMRQVKELFKSMMTDRQRAMIRGQRQLWDSMKREPLKRRTCNVCGFEGIFNPFGWPLRIDAHCPQCKSLERHRLLKLWLSSNAGAIQDKDTLHFAPEACVAGFVRPLARSYVTADVEAGRADLVLDIERIDLAPSSFDVVICSHVLEHVDDRKALPELFRILRPGGVCILLVPLIEGWDATFEDPSITDPRERADYFGQFDHVRYYGANFRDRVRDAGFGLTEFTAVEPFVTRHGLQRGEKVFIAQRPN